MGKLLLIGENKALLEPLIDVFQREKPDWQISSVQTEREARISLADESIKMLVSESKLSSEFSESFHSLQMDSNSDLTNLMICNNGDVEWLSSYPGLAHEYFDSGAADLIQKIVNSANLHEIVNGGSSHSQGIADRILPTLPETYMKVVEAIEGEVTGIADVAEVVTRDVALSAKILHLVNSAYYSLSRKIESIQDAIGLIGLETVKALTLTEAVFGEFEQYEIENLTVHHIYDRSLDVGLSAQKIAKDIGLDSQGMAQAFFGGLLHQIGILILLVHFPEFLEQAFRKAQKDETSLLQAETDILGTNHALISSYLLATWKFPFEISNAVAYCEDPMSSPSRTVNPLSAVFLATLQKPDAFNFSNRQDSGAEYFARIEIERSMLQKVLGVNTPGAPVTG